MASLKIEALLIVFGLGDYTAFSRCLFRVEKSVKELYMQVLSKGGSPLILFWFDVNIMHSIDMNMYGENM